MSRLPYPPGRLDPKKSDKPSAEMLGELSRTELLTGDPRFMGSDQGLSVVSRVAKYVSRPPYPPGRLEMKKSDRLSVEILD